MTQTSDGIGRLAAGTANLRGVKRAGLACLFGAISVLGFAPLHFWPVLFVSFGGLVWLLDGCHLSHSQLKDRLKCASLTGFWFGYGFFLAGLYWVAEAFLVEPWRHGWLIPFVMAALPGGMALFYAASSGLAMALWHTGAARVFALGLAFGLAELARGHILTGLPWNLIGYGLLPNEPLMQLAAVFGVYNLSLLGVVLFASLASIWNAGAGRSGGAIVTAVVSLALLASAYVWGDRRLAEAPAQSEDVRVRIVQANVDQADKWRPENASRIFSDYLGLTETAGLDGIDIVVWPETALPFLLGDSPDALTAIGDVLPTNAVLLVGAARLVERRGTDGRLLRRDSFNSVLLIDSSGKVTGSYDKIHLVPFGEYLPFQEFLESLGVMQMTGVRGGFSEGRGPRLMEIPGAPPLVPLICYEIIFPHEVTDRDRGSQWLLNLTNDAWFGSSAGPYQHFFQARVRAVEQGLPLIRGANTGISAIVDPWGRVLAEIGLDEKGILDGSLPSAAPGTVYAKHSLQIEIVVFVFAALVFALISGLRRTVRT